MCHVDEVLWDEDACFRLGFVCDDVLEVVAKWEGTRYLNEGELLRTCKKENYVETPNSLLTYDLQCRPPSFAVVGHDVDIFVATPRKHRKTAQTAQRHAPLLTVVSRGTTCGKNLI